MGTKCPKCNTDNPSDSKYCKECATSLPSSEEIPASPTKTLETPTEELTRGTTFAGRYEIIEELGKGGMGKVYRVEDKKIKEEVALKLIKPEIASDKKTIERFSNELRIARKISHRNVCRMYDLGEEKGTYYITMEYVPGEDLKSSIRRFGQIPIGKTISIAKQICEGMAEAHRLGVVHRDLKPQNIMIDKEGNARIMDFGIARSLKGKGITGAGVMIGTPEYMSPEQAEVKEVDQRSDIYSLGVILYEMVTGRVPFEGETSLSIAMKHKSETPKDPKELNPQIPEDLSQLILRCLEKDKENRYQTADEVHSELTNIEKRIPTTEKEIPKRKPATSKEITVQFSLRKILIPVLVVVALLALIAPVVIWKLLPKKETVSIPSDKPSIAVLSFTDLSPEKKYEYLCDGMAETLINSLSPIKELKVSARTSTFSFKGKEQDIREIGQKLGVKNVLEGSVQVAGNKIRITARLSKTEDGFQLWSESYNRELEDIFAIQDDIAQTIVRILKIQLLGKGKGVLVKKYTENIEAYNLYLQGRFLWNKRTEDGLKKAIEKFEVALRLDPNYPLALVGISDCYNLLHVYSNSNPNETLPKAKEFALKALEIDKNLAEAHTSLAWVKCTYDWDWEGAEIEYKQAIELNPGYATAHHWYGLHLSFMGRFDEAINEINKALELDPVSLVIKKDSSYPYLFNRQYDKAIEILNNTVEMNPDFPGPHIYLGWLYFCKSIYKKALKEFREERRIRKDWNARVEAWIGIIYANMGMKEEAIQILNDLIEHSKYEYVSPLRLALLYFDLGEKALYQNSLDKVFEERDAVVPTLKSPIFDNLRSDKAFIELLRKVNLLEK